MASNRTLKRRIDSVPVAGKRVLVRVDYNVPIEDGRITDDRRIKASLPTLRSVLERGGSLVLMSHLGRPEGKGYEASESVEPCARRLAELLGPLAPHGVVVPGKDCTDDATAAAVAALKPGGVLLLENLRFHKGEKKGDPAFAAKLAAYGDVYVNDAFGTSHRTDASMHAVPLAMAGKPRVAGFLLDAELEYLMARLEDPARPFVAALGGAKVSDKLLAIERLLATCDTVLVGGAMAYTLLKAGGVEIGASLVEPDMIETARSILSKAYAPGSRCRLLLPVDHVCGERLAAGVAVRTVEGPIPAGWMGLDIGPRTETLFAAAVADSRTFVWNGPMGAFETRPFDRGTRSLAAAAVAATARGTVTIAGGGDTAAAVEEFGAAAGFSHVSTGGGASLEVLEGKHLTCLDALDAPA